MNEVKLSGTLQEEPKQFAHRLTVATSAVLTFASETSVARIFAIGNLSQQLSEFHAGDGVRVEGRLITSPEGVLEIIVNKVEPHRAGIHRDTPRPELYQREAPIISKKSRLFRT
jgi:hypothetical protein